MQQHAGQLCNGKLVWMTTSACSSLAQVSIRVHVQKVLEGGIMGLVAVRKHTALDPRIVQSILELTFNRQAVSQTMSCAGNQSHCAQLVMQFAADTCTRDSDACRFASNMQPKPSASKALTSGPHLSVHQCCTKGLAVLPHQPSGLYVNLHICLIASCV